MEKSIFHLIKSTLGHPGFQRYFFNTGWMFAEKILRLLAGLFVGAYVARYLAPAQFGLLNYVLSIVSIFSIVATLGLDTIIIRQLLADATRRNIILGTAFRMRLMASVLVFLTVTGIVFVTDPEPITRILVVIIAAGIFLETFAVIDFFFQSGVQSKLTVWSQMCALLITSIVRILLVFSEASLTAFAWTYLLDLAILAGGLTLFYVRLGLKLVDWKFDASVARKFLKDSWPLLVSSLALIFYLKIGQLMIRWMLGDEAVGNYGVAVRLSEMWNFIPMAICASLFPAILNAKRTDELVYQQRLQRLYDLMVGISLSIAVFMSFFAGFIVDVLFGNAYHDAAQVIVLYIWSGVFVFLGVANGKWILAENLQVYRMVNLLITAVLNVILNFLLIKMIGLLGAAVSTLISQAYAWYFSFLFSSKTRVAFISMTRSFNPFRLIRFFVPSSNDSSGREK